MINDFEEMLMWTSYRYAIGRKTYVSCLSYEIPQHYYKKLSKEKREFTALDIRKEILNHLAFMPFSLSITRWNSEDEYNPLETIFNFIENIVNMILMIWFAGKLVLVVLMNLDIKYIKERNILKLGEKN